MGNGFFIITGTSRGIGEALAKKVLEEGHTVLGVSRNRSEKLHSPQYHHLSFDLSDTAHLDQVIENASDILTKSGFDFVCLVNNAATIEPTGVIEACPAPEIEAHVKIDLISPMLLTSLFIGRFSSLNARKKIAFISSGAAFHASPGESMYCSTKAGLLMFAQCVGLEQADRQDGFEVLSIGPGMVDTAMQLVIRSKTREEFARADFFKQAFESGRLQDPARVAEKILAVLENRYEQGKYVSVNEI